MMSPPNSYAAGRTGLLLLGVWLAGGSSSLGQLATTLYAGPRGTTVLAPPPGLMPLDPLSVSAYWGFWPSRLLARQPIGHQIIATSPNGYVYRPVYADDATAASIALPAAEERIPSAAREHGGNSVNELFSAALAEFKGGGYEAAIDGANRVLDLQPDHGDALLLLVQCHFALGNYQASAAALAAALSTAPEYDWEKYTANYKKYFRSSLRFALHLRALERFVAEQPDLPAGHLLIGYYYGSLGETPRALAELAAAQPDVAAETLTQHFAAQQDAPAPGLDADVDANGGKPPAARPRGRAF
jgi:tetratricopeptide (TPR) repeat protein